METNRNISDEQLDEVIDYIMNTHHQLEDVTDYLFGVRVLTEYEMDYILTDVFYCGWCGLWIYRSLDYLNAEREICNDCFMDEMEGMMNNYNF